MKRIIFLSVLPDSSIRYTHSEQSERVFSLPVLPERNEAVGRMKSNGSTVRYLKYLILICAPFDSTPRCFATRRSRSGRTERRKFSPLLNSTLFLLICYAIVTIK